jgi:hypothetical protein
MISPLPSPMTVYDGTIPIGKIEDYRSHVVAYDPAGNAIGRFRDRKAAIAAVNALHDRRKAAGSARPPDGSPEAA